MSSPQVFGTPEFLREGATVLVKKPQTERPGLPGAAASEFAQVGATRNGAQFPVREENARLAIDRFVSVRDSVADYESAGLVSVEIAVAGKNGVVPAGQFPQRFAKHRAVPAAGKRGADAPDVRDADVRPRAMSWRVLSPGS